MSRRAPLLTILCRWPSLLGAALALLVAVHGLLPGLHQLLAHGAHPASSSTPASCGQHGDPALSTRAGDLDEEAGCPICHQLQVSGDIALPTPAGGTCVSGNEPVASLRWLIRQVRGRPDVTGISARGPPPA
ncbi:MAG: hypothetical protein H0X38_08910 [Planctomycetes bacterium]|nr:hypothetical protein [Planctomycetota bacterium]